MSNLPESAAGNPPEPGLERLRPAARSDELALTAIYEAHRGELFAFLIRMTRDREAAEDLVQETFIRLIKQARSGHTPEAVRPWLYRVAANAAISRMRRGATWMRLLPRLVDRRESGQPEGDFLRSEQERELHTALAGLAPDARAALLLAAEGFNGQEIAASIGRSEAATRTLLCRSRIRLRLALEAAESRS
jgi:RNA polymerase sigma-70 factor (ECF subfamily)